MEASRDHDGLRGSSCDEAHPLAWGHRVVSSCLQLSVVVLLSLHRVETGWWPQPPVVSCQHQAGPRLTGDHCHWCCAAIMPCPCSHWGDVTHGAGGYIIKSMDNIYAPLILKSILLNILSRYALLICRHLCTVQYLIINILRHQIRFHMFRPLPSCLQLGHLYLFKIHQNVKSQIWNLVHQLFICNGRHPSRRQPGDLSTSQIAVSC